MMIHGINGKAAPPWWAAIVAPLVGVPLMVGLLAITTPGPTDNVGAVAAQPVEQVSDCETPSEPPEEQLEPIWEP